MKILWIVSCFIISAAAANAEELPSPRLVIISSSSINGTSVANVLIGADPGCEDCLKDLCDEALTDCNMKYGTGHWVGDLSEVSVFLAFDFGEPNDYEKTKITINTMKDFIQKNNKFLIIFNSSIHNNAGSFDEDLDQVVSQLGALFGRDFWSRVVLGASDWHYDADSIASRNQSGKTETWWSETMSVTIRERFDVPFDLPAVFIDPDAKLDENVDDPLQMGAFNTETGKLLSMLKATVAMDFVTLQEKFDEQSNVFNGTLNRMQAQIDQLISDVIDNSIDVDYLKGVIALNQIDIESHKEQLDELDLNVTDLKTQTVANVTFLSDLIYEIEAGGQPVPGIGSIVAWIPGLINLKYSFHLFLFVYR